MWRGHLRKKMNRYYGLTDSSHVYCIAMVLHPGLKLEYFRRQKWDEEWIEMVEDLTRDQYMNYKRKVTSEDTILEAQTTQTGTFFDFANVSVTQTTPPKTSELDEYLCKPVENVADPLKWWYSNQFMYPTLHRMALDYLSVPTTSTEVERIFSQGRLILHFTHNRLSPRAFLCMGSWGWRDMIVLEDIIQAIKSRKWKHLRAGTPE
jgi:hAT family C-terminal dimerisation region